MVPIYQSAYYQNPYIKSEGLITCILSVQYYTYRVGIRRGSKMRQANLVIYFVSSLDFRSATDTGFITPNVVPKDPLELVLHSRNS